MAACRPFGKSGRLAAIRLVMDRSRPGVSIGLPNTSLHEAFVVAEIAGFKPGRVAGRTSRGEGLR